MYLSGSGVAASRTPAVARVAFDATRRSTLTLVEGASDWTLVAGAPAAAPTIEAGPLLRTVYTAAQTGEVAAAVTAPSATHAIAPKSWAFRVTVKLAAVTNVDGNSQLHVSLEDAARNYAWGVRLDLAAGSAWLGEAVTAAYPESSAYVPAAGVWLRCTFKRGALHAEVGVGATLAAATWSDAGDVYRTRGAAAPLDVPTVLRVAVAQIVASGAVTTVDLSDVTWDDLEEV